MMTCEHLRGSFELYALGLLDESDEKSAIAAHLDQGCPACNARMKDALAIQALMLSQAPEVLPPMRLKRRVLGAVGIQPMGWTWFAAVCAAAMLVTALWYGVISSERRRQRDEARASLAEAITERDRLHSAFQFFQDPQTKQYNFGDPNSQHGIVYLHPQLGLLLIASKLPPVPEGRMYQLWIMPKHGGAAQPAGTFRSAADATAVYQLNRRLNPADISGVAVTVEPASGSQMPTLPLLFTAPIG